MNYKFRTGDIVRVKNTGEKATVREIVGFTHVPAYWIDTDKTQGIYVFESELKPFRPSRTGTRDPKTGRFVSKDFYGYNFTATEIQQQKIKNTRMNNYLDSKQRNYQKIEKLKDSSFYVWDVNGKEIQGHEYLNKITTKLERIEKKIDELGRKV